MPPFDASAPPQRLPRDYGMTGLGLLMQAIGGLAIAFNAGMIVPSFKVGGGKMILYLLAVVTSGLIRSSLHYAAGQKLTSSTPDGWLAARRYAIFGVAQAIIVVAVGVGLFPDALPTSVITVAFLALAAWPVTILLLISRPGLKAAYSAAYDGDHPIWPRDRGLQGAAALMIALGLLGTLLSISILLVFVSSRAWFTQDPGVTDVLGGGVVVLLVVRSVVHFAGGLGGLRTNYIGFITAINRYFTWAVLSVGLLVVVLFLVMADKGGVGGLLYVALLVAGLLIWPAVLNGLAKQIPWDMDDVGAPNGEAVDGGLSALGFLILAMGLYGVVALLGLLAMAGDRSLVGMLISAVLGSSAGGLSVWIGGAMSIVTVWAGVEICLMTPRFKLAGTVYGLLGIAVALYGTYNTVSSGGLSGPMQTAALIGLGVGFKLALPIIALWLSNRPLPKVTDYSSVFE